MTSFAATAATPAPAPSTIPAFSGVAVVTASTAPVTALLERAWAFAHRFYRLVNVHHLRPIFLFFRRRLDFISVIAIDLARLQFRRRGLILWLFFVIAIPLSGFGRLVGVIEIESIHVAVAFLLVLDILPGPAPASLVAAGTSAAPAVLRLLPAAPAVAAPALLTVLLLVSTT